MASLLEFPSNIKNLYRRSFNINERELNRTKGLWQGRTPSTFHFETRTSLELLRFYYLKGEKPIPFDLLLDGDINLQTILSGIKKPYLKTD